jgi:nitroreductase
VIDCSLAGENILLAVESLGLGALWTAAYPDKDRMDTIRKILKIPDDIIPLNVIPIGHPTGEDKPKDKFNPENIHWEKW